jgi:integrase
MGKIYKRGQVWYIDVRYKRRRIRRSVGSSKKIAELALKDTEVQIAKDKFGFSKNDIDFAKFVESFLEYSRAHHRPRSTERYREVIDHFRRFLEAHANVSFLSEITTELVDRYKAYRKGNWVNGNGVPVVSENDLSPKTRKGARAHTVNFEIDTLRLFFNLAIKWGYLSDNPTKGTVRLKVDDAKPPRFLTEEECQLLLDACPVEQKRMFLTFLSTGMRKAELENLQWQDIDLKRHQIAIRGKEDWQPKAGQRDIPISPSVLEVFTELREENPSARPTDYVFRVKRMGRSRNWMRTQLIQLAAQAGVENLTKLHTLRHTFASHLVMNGVDLPTVMKLMGHSDIQTAMIYAHLAPDHLANAVTKLPFKRR